MSEPIEDKQQYRKLLEALPDCVVLVGLDGKLLLANQAAARLYGCDTVEELTSSGKTAFDLIAPEDLGRTAESMRQTIEQGTVLNLEYTLLTKDGRRYPAEVSVAALKDDNGNPSAFLSVVRDISGRRNIEAALRDSEAKYAAVVEGAKDIVVIVQDGICQFVNPAISQLGYTVDQVVGRPFIEMVAPDAVDEMMQRYQARMAGENPEHIYSSRILNHSGEIVEVEVTISRIHYQDRPALLSIVRDTTERWKAENALRESEARYRSLVETLPDGLTVTDLEGNLVMVNEQSARRYGCRSTEELLASGKTVFDFIVPEERPRAIESTRLALQTGTVRSLEYTLARKDGSTYPVEINASVLRDLEGNPTGFIGLTRDVSERKRAEEERRKLQAQLLHAQKLESLGVLAGGIAHDFNNLLMGVLGNASLALMEAEPGSPTRVYLEHIEKTGQHAAELTNQMLAYSGKGKFVVKPVNLSALVKGMSHLLKVSISKKVTLRFDFDRDLPTIDADATQMSQVIMNLITNAAEATGDQGDSVMVRTGVMEVDRQTLADSYLDDDLPAGRYVLLEVSDSGCGMDARTRTRIFDPFFTTKFTGRGLGLAAVLGIVRGHKGAIRVSSKPGRGSTFQVLFPEGTLQESTGDLPPERIVPPRTDGTVLIIDDEKLVRDVTGNMLESSGFRVLLARNGPEGLEFFEKHSDEIALVLLDNTMPVMDGEEVFDHLRRIKPDVRVILSSGFNEHEAISRFAGKGLAAFLQKPYRLDQLNRTLSKVLGKDS